MEKKNVCVVKVSFYSLQDATEHKRMMDGEERRTIHPAGMILKICSRPGRCAAAKHFYKSCLPSSGGGASRLRRRSDIGQPPLFNGHVSLRPLLSSADFTRQNKRSSGDAGAALDGNAALRLPRRWKGKRGGITGTVNAHNQTHVVNDSEALFIPKCW